MRLAAKHPAGFGVGDARGDAGQGIADGAGHALAVIGVGGVHVGLGHAVALENGMAGACNHSRCVSASSGAEPETNSRMCLSSPCVSAGMMQQPHIEGRHAHQHGRTRHQCDDQVGIEFRQEDHRGAREQGDVARDEQAVGVEDRQRMDQDVVPL